MKTNPEMTNKSSIWLSIGAGLAAIGASVCCVVPLFFVFLGIGGAWISTLTSMESTRPFFIVLTLIFIILGFRQIYWLPSQCRDNDACSLSDVQRRQRIIFWISSILILLLLVFPWFAPLFFII